jgi:O-antigen/teichoic acid export membrane protein
MNDRLNPQQIFKNLLMLSLTTYLEYAVYVVTSIVIARTLGPDNYGIYAYAIFLCGLFISVSTHGINLTVTNFAAAAVGKSDPLTGRSIVSKLFRWQVGSIVVVLTLAMIYLVLFTPKELKLDLYFLLAIIAGAVTFKTLFMFLMSVGKGYGNFKVGNIASASASLISLAAIAYLGWHQGSILAFLVVYLIACALSALIAYWLLRRQVFSVPTGHPIEESMSKRLSIATWQSAGSMILVTFSIRSFETLALKAEDVTQVGYFAIATMLSKGIADIIVGVCDRILLPEFSRRLSQSGVEALGAAFISTTRYYWFLGMLMVGLGFCVAVPLVTTLYTPAYLPAGVALKYSLVATGFGALLSPSNAVQIALEDQIHRIYLLVFSLIVSAVGSFALVPKFGLMGAVSSFGITLFVMSFLSYRQTVSALKLRPQFFAIFKITAAAGFALLLTSWIWLQNTIWGAVLSMTLFCFVFTIQTALLKCWSKDELNLAANGLKKLGLVKNDSEFVERMIQQYGRSE